jgi:membrane protein DedA with SNARE-associated domain
MDQGALVGLIGNWGLPAVWLGGVVEGEAAGFMGGLLAHRGFFPLWAAALALAAGGFTCDQICFWAGRLLSSRPLVRRVLDRPGAAAMAARIAPHPVLWAFGLRWLYGLRIVTATVLGASGAAPLPVALSGAVAALAWGAVVTAAGYGLAHWLVGVVGNLALHHHVALMVGAGLALALVIGHFTHRLLRKR